MKEDIKYVNGYFIDNLNNRYYTYEDVISFYQKEYKVKSLSERREELINEILKDE